ncbi:hypothetical protein BWI17_15100 [Betaproteobacteria bacterium GR16-43]|nr:hypothetical protein BWI17_15100 [Betaproteobacteria bacterium GR16-43]
MRDFDFLHGDWEVANRRLKQRHVGSTDWDEFPGLSSIRPVLGGLGNVDELRFPTRGWVDEGLPVRVRFYWTVLSDKRAHWEQAFSTDGEKTWETNWTMDFRRAEPEAPGLASTARSLL